VFFPGGINISVYDFISRPFFPYAGQSLKSFSVLALGIVAVTFLYTFDPAVSNLYVPCPFRELSGFYCPGCGSLRALHQLFHGHLVTAFGLNPLTVLFLPFLGYSFLSYIVVGISGRTPPTVFVSAVYIWIILGIIVIFWILRNIPFFPFTLLAPS
jgi:hypothetical protein